jgi:diguanylate cyclase (GGDEF)-like protein
MNGTQINSFSRGEGRVTSSSSSCVARSKNRRRSGNKTINGLCEIKAVDETAKPKAFELFCDTFEDGIAIIDAEGKYTFFNEPYRSLHRGVEDHICVGGRYNEALEIGLDRSVWNLHGETEDLWLARHGIAVNTKRRETYLAFADGRWLLRRICPHKSGSFVEICSDLTTWKEKEDGLNEALKRAAAAEERSRLALQMEEARKKEEELLSQLNHWLHSCKKLPELNSVVESFLAKLLPGSTGTLFVYNNSRDVLVPVCAWNGSNDSSEMKADDCWGLRQGRAYHYGRDGWRFPCGHIQSKPESCCADEYYCIPILARGDTAGMLHVSPSKVGASEEETSRRWFRLACKCAEQISLAIANVKLSQELKDQSTRDPLTRLFNRRYFAERCSREISHAKQCGTPSSLISIDIDHFKKFNDNFGHDAGDIVLKGFSRVLTDHFRGSDIVCRIGGEEFIVLLPGASEKIALLRANELLPKVQAMKVRYGNETLPGITVSAGVIEFPSAGDCLEDILKAADKALYAAKADGRNRVSTFAAKHLAPAD